MIQCTDISRSWILGKIETFIELASCEYGYAGAYCSILYAISSELTHLTTRRASKSEGVIYSKYARTHACGPGAAPTETDLIFVRRQQIHVLIQLITVLVSSHHGLCTSLLLPGDRTGWP